MSEQRREAERAAQIQRHLLPSAALEIEGYELAGGCLPAQDVAGDFYDWFATPEGRIDLTLADVMGKGVGAALVMATLRAVLRSTPAAAEPGERVAAAAASLARGLTDEGLFVTLFHARLDPATGWVRYVDAGHGYCAIRSASGELVPLPVRSLPLGVHAGEAFAEGEARLEPGDALVVYSDGLVEREDRSLDLRSLAGPEASRETAALLLDCMLSSVPAQQSDDVTAVVLRRRPLAPVPAER